MVIVYRKQMIAGFNYFELLMFAQYLAGVPFFFFLKPPYKWRKFGLQGDAPTWISQCLDRWLQHY